MCYHWAISPACLTGFFAYLNLGSVWERNWCNSYPGIIIYSSFRTDFSSLHEVFFFWCLKCTHNLHVWHRVPFIYFHYVSMNVCACAHKCMHLGVYVEAWRGCQVPCSIPVHFIFLKRDLSLELKLDKQLLLPLTLPTLPHLTWYLDAGCRKFNLRSSWLHSKCVSSWAISSAPNMWFKSQAGTNWDGSAGKNTCPQVGQSNSVQVFRPIR